MKLNENVKRVLMMSLWDLATSSKDGEPNVVPVTFKGILDDGRLSVGDVFLETTLRNLEKNIMYHYRIIQMHILPRDHAQEP